MKSIFTCLLILSQFHLSAQCLLRELPLNQRTSRSELIVEGRVIAKQSYWNENKTMIYTSNTVEVLKIFKGSVSASTIDIVTEGGVVGLRMIKVDPSLSLRKGMVGIFMCENTSKTFKKLPANTRGIPRYKTFGSVQGFIKYDLAQGTAADPFRKYRSVQNELYKTFSPLMNYKVVKSFEIRNRETSTHRIQAIDNFNPTTTTAGTGQVLTIVGAGFGAAPGTVRFSNADDGGASYIDVLPSQIIFWSATQIAVEVPAGAGTGDFQVVQGATTFTSATALTIDYAHTNIDYDLTPGDYIAYQTEHIDANAIGGITLNMHTAFDANAPARISFTRALDSWRCATGINLTVGTTTASNTRSQDGESVVAFDDADALDPGVLGVCQSAYGGCFDGGGNLVWFSDEMDIIFDNGDNIAPDTWEFGPATPTSSEYDFESVALHELGHGHQLGHVIDPGAVMHYALSNGATSRTLSANDLAAGNFVQAKSEIGNFCGPTAMTEYSGCGALPITITTISAVQKGHGVQVEWINENESNVHHYEVEESGNGGEYSRAVTVEPTGNNSQRASYQWFDAQVASGTNFYRVKAVGHDGDVKYSQVATVNFAGNNKTFSIYPNPVSGKSFTVAFSNLPKGTYTLDLFNTVGQRLMSKTLVHGGGNAIQTISLPSVAAGVYSVRLQGNGVREKPIMLTIK